MDTDYWENVLQQLQLAMARATVAAVYDNVQQKRYALIGGKASEARQPSWEADASGEVESEAAAAGGAAERGRYSPQLFADDEVELDEGDAEELGVEVTVQSELQSATGGGASSSSAADAAPGRYSPTPLTSAQVARELESAIDAAEDARQLQAMRDRIKSGTMDKMEPVSHVTACNGCNASSRAQWTGWSR